MSGSNAPALMILLEYLASLKALANPCSPHPIDPEPVPSKLPRPLYRPGAGTGNPRGPQSTARQPCRSPGDVLPRRHDRG